MANSSPFLHIQDPRNGPVQSTIEVLPQTDSDDGTLLQNGHRPDVDHAVSYHGMGCNYGDWAQYCQCDNASYQGPPVPLPAASVDLDGQYPYHGNLDLYYPRNGQDNACGPHPPPPAHVTDIPNGGVRGCAPLMTDFANSFTQSVPDSTPSGTLAMESLKRLADRYLHDPGSRIETLHVGLSPSGGQLRVTIVFDMDVPDSPPAGTLAMESLKRLADRYLHDPGSRIETLRVGLSPSGGQLKVTIVFDMDV